MNYPSIPGVKVKSSVSWGRSATYKSINFLCFVLWSLVVVVVAQFKTHSSLFYSKQQQQQKHLN